MKADVTALDQFGLDLRALSHLRERNIEVTVHLNSFEITSAVVRRPPEERHPYLRARASRWLARLSVAFPKSQWVIKGQSREIPTEVSGTISSRRLPALASQPGVRLVSVSRVPGYRRARRRLDLAQWFCVRSRVVIQIEEQAEGMQTVEDRLVLVRAASPEDAERRVRKSSREYAEPYLNPYGQLVRWSLEEITDVYGPVDDYSTAGEVEVYSKLSTRRMKPESVWHPRRTGV